MGDFDDVLAMEPGDDWASWDEWAAGESARATAEQAPPLAEFRLPNAWVHLRGAAPAEVLDLFADLTHGGADLTHVGGDRSHVGGDLAEPALELGDDAPLVTFVLEELAGGGVSIVDPDQGEFGRVANTADAAELTASIAAALTEVADRTDPTRVHLGAACVERDTPDGTPGGVMLVDPDRASRHALTAAMLSGGARYLSADRTVLLPGSRTVVAEPMPLHLRTGWTKASALGSTRPYTSIGAVVLVEHRPGAAPSIEQLGTAQGCAYLLDRTGAVAQAGSDAFEPVAALAGGASFWHLVHDDADAAALLALGTRAPERRQLVTAGALDGVRWARFDSGAVLVDGADGRVEVIDDARADELEQQLPRTNAATPAADLFGLPDTPRHRLGAGDTPVADPADTADPAGTAEPAGTADPAGVGRAVAVLERMADLFDADGGGPVVLGEMVQAHEGTVPEGFARLDRVDLLVDRQTATGLAEALQSSGFVPAPQRIGLTEGSSSVTWWAPTDGVTVGLHWQLAAGPFGELVDHDELAARTVPCRIGGRWYRALCPEDRFVLACVRAASIDRPTPSDLRPVVLQVPRDPALMASAMEASERWGATRAVLAAVRAADSVLPGVPPWMVDRAERGNGRSRTGRQGRRRRR